MTALHTRVKQEKLNMRINSEERGLIDRAAKIRGKNRTDFILSAAHKEAEDTILEQVMFQVSTDAYTEFLARLDKAPSPNQRLLKTMKTEAIWDKK